MDSKTIKEQYKQWESYAAQLKEQLDNAKENMQLLAQEAAKQMRKPVPEGGSASESIGDGVKIKAVSTIKPSVDKDKYSEFMNSERAKELDGLFKAPAPKLNDSMFKKLIKSNPEAMSEIGASYSTDTKYTISIEEEKE